MKNARGLALVCLCAPSAAACGLILGLQPTGAASDAGTGNDASAPADHSPTPASDGGESLPTEAGLPASYRDEVMADRPVAYWRFADDSPPKTGHDETGRYGIVYGPTCRLSSTSAGGSRDDTALEATGDCYVDPAGIRLGDAFTLEAWIKPLGTLDSRRTILEDVQGLSALTLFLDKDRPHCTLSGGGAFFEALGPPIVNDRYTHVVAAYDGNLVVYVDGGAGDATRTALKLEDMTPKWRVGARVPTAPAESFAGLIDEVAIYDRGLPPARIKAHYAAGPK